MAGVAGSLVAATDAGAVAVVVPETAIASAQYSPVYNSSVGPPAFACNADGCLAAWRDGRQGLGYRIWARRLLADGTPRDPAAFLVSVDTFDSSDPVVATNGTSFLVGWSDVSTEMYLTRIDADDSLHSESALVRDLSADPVRPVAIASNGDGYLLVFAYPVGTPGGTIKALRADRDGHVLDASSILISDDPSARGIADVLWTGTQYLVVWNQGQGDGGDAYGARVTADGTVLDASGFLVATLGGFSNQPRLALGGGKVLLAAGRNAGSSGGNVVAFLLDTDGMNGRPISLPIASSQLTGMTAAAAWNGSAFVATWIDGPTDRPVAVRIAPDGTVMDAAQIVLATATQTQTPAIAVASTTAFIVYVDTSYQALPVRLVSLSASGVVGLTNAAPLDVSAAPQRLLATARGDGQTLVIWADDAQGIYASALLAARVSDAGAVLDATPIVLSAAVPNKQGAVAAAAWAGGQYLVSWWEKNGLTTDQFQVARVSGAGALLDATPTVLGTNLFFSQVSAIVPNGDDFLVVWSEQGIISTPAPINAVTIGPDGKALGASFTIGPAQASYPWAVAAAVGGGTLAAWNVFSSGPAFGVDMETIDAASVQGTPVHVSQQQGSSSLALVPAPGRTLVWLNGRVGMLLMPVPPFAALSGTNVDAGRNIGLPSWNGAVYVSAGVTTPGIYDYDSAGVDVSGLSKDGVLFNPATTVVPPRPLTTLAPTVVGLAPDKNLVLYSRLVPEHDQGALRVRFQIVDSTFTPNPDGGVPTDGGSDIDSGTGRDGGTGRDSSTGRDSGAIRDGGRAMDARDAREASVARDASDLDLSGAKDAAPEAAHRDSAAPDAPAADASRRDAGRPDTGGAGGAPAPRDATADAGRGSSSGCSCTTAAPGAADRGPSSAALLLFVVAACLRRRHRRSSSS
jgi:hypothetical protein